MKKITLIDGNSLMFRSYYATAYRGELMKTKNGLYTNALFGFCNMVNGILNTVEYAFIAFDAGKQTFRHQQFQDYKATRKALPDELRVQIPYIKKYLDLINISHTESLDYEADDFLASCATSFYDDFDEIQIITGDKDLLQMVNDKIKVCLTRKGVVELEEFNKENFFEKMGIYPNQIPDYKGIVGDTSDNLPGIKGIGEKTAVKLLSSYTSLESIIENVESISGKIKELIKKSKDIAINCKDLATLKKDINLDFTIDDLKVKDYDVDELVNFFKEVEFYSFLKKIDKKKTVTINHNLEIITDVHIPLKDILNTDAFISIEVFKSYYNGKFLGMSFVNDSHQIFLTTEVVLNNQDVKNYLENNQYAKKTFDCKMLYLVFKKYGFNLENITFDAMLALYLINPAYTTADFKTSIDNYCSNDITYYDNIYGTNTKMKIPELEVYAKYSVDKCLILRKIESDILKEIEKRDLVDLLDVEIKLSKVLAKMEYDGLVIDLIRLDEVGKDLEAKAEEIAQDIYFIAGEEFNINSPKKLGEILFDKLHLPHGKKNKTGYSTNVDVLEKLAEDFVIAKDILEYRTYNKLITTYVNGLKQFVDSDHHIHPLYRQAETLTGRLSSTEPNIQNIPIRTEEGQVIREIFVSRFLDGMIVSADYSQIELRILAHLSNDPAMIDAFNNSVDFHSQTASKIYEVKLEQVTKQMRRTAKAINFGIIYGMSAWGLSETIHVSPLEANIYINKYFDTFKRVKEFLDETVKKAKEDGFTLTIFNRRRYIPELTSSNANLKSFGERTAMNAPMQGSAADIIKVAMNKIYLRFNDEKLKSLMIAQIHDELIFDCVADEVEIVKKIVKEEMENVIKLRVQLISEVNVGKNWALAK